MSRVKRGTTHVKRRRTILALAKGYRWSRSHKLKQAKTAIIKAGAYAYRDRRNKKRSMRSLWLIQMNAALRAAGTTYSRFIDAEKKAGVILDRKILAELARTEPAIFAKIVAEIKQ